MAGNPPLQLRIDAARRARWQAAADRAGMKLTDWARDRLDKADEPKSPSSVSVVVSGGTVVPGSVVPGGKRFTGPDPKPSGK